MDASVGGFYNFERKRMKNLDDEVLKKIKNRFKQDITDDNLSMKHEELTALYSDLSFTRSYELQELFPNIPTDYRPSSKVFSRAKELSVLAQQRWSTDLSKNGPRYFSCREGFRERTGIDIGREYAYPDGMSPQEFQESFNGTVVHKMISSRINEMAVEALVGFWNGAVSDKLFLEKEKPISADLIKSAYHKFWEVNSGIPGYEELKKIQNFDKMRNFLMGVASEIPLDDVAAFLSNDEKVANELAKNNVKFKKEFQTENNITFEMTDKTWKKHIQPVLDQRKAEKKKSSTLRSTVKKGQAEYASAIRSRTQQRINERK